MRQTIKRAKISFNFQELDAGELVIVADGTVVGLTNNTNLPNPPVALATVSSQTAALRSILNKIESGNTSTALTKLEAQAINDIMQTLVRNGHYVEDTANATAVGNLEKAEEITLSSGYKLKKKGVFRSRSFEVANIGISFIHLRAKKAGKGTEAHLWRYGITTAKGTAPVTLKTYITVEADIIINNLLSASIIGIQHASIMPVSSNNETDASSTSANKKAGSVTLSNAKHPVFSHTTDDPYQWTDFIYAVVS